LRHKSFLRLIVTFLFGVLTTLIGIYLLLITRSNENLPLQPLESYRPQFTLEGASGIEQKREQIIGYIFGENLPSTLPQVEGSELTVGMPRGFESMMSLQELENTCSSETLLIYHAGHFGSTHENDLQAVQSLAAADYPVLVIDMPLIGLNASPVPLDLPNVGNVEIGTYNDLHDQMMFLDQADDYSILRYFLEPVVVALNWADEVGYEHIVAVGLSGGGWTVTLAAAIDERIDQSYPVAGSLPIGLRFRSQKNWGDYEQLIPEFYTQIATYEDLYTMGAYGRQQVQILNAQDPCCFNDLTYAMYENAIQDVLKGDGNFRVYWDAESSEHHISDSAIAQILEGVPDDYRPNCVPNP